MADEVAISEPLALRELIPADGIFNFRQLGGYKVEETGRSTCCNFIYRSGHIEDMTAKDSQLLKALGISVVFDLRNQGEAELCTAFYNRFDGNGQNVTHTASVNRDVKTIHIPMVKTNFTHATKVEEYLYAADEEAMAKKYLQILTSENGAEAIRTILLRLIHHPREPFLIHCSLGKDRTGVVSALILSLAGVGDELIAAEYGLSKSGLMGTRSGLRRLTLATSPHLSEQENRKVVDGMLRVTPSSIIRMLKLLRSEYGSLPGYIQKVCRISSADIENIQMQLTGS